ncbi:MAG: bifunctional adenosylcobinamide kinase/adenosylcobinamide-phosphate guanylyltransferase [Woeseiaceae bacterium]
MTQLVLGGARSGKSTFAQQTAEASKPKQIFVATAEALDEEMTTRIQRHVSDRGESWITIEAPLALAAAIQANCSDEYAVVVDCLTLWLSNILHKDLDVDTELERLVGVVAMIETPLILVSNEVGMGIVPASELGRRFRDAQGQLNKAMATVVDRVDFVAAGLPLRLKG